MTNEAALIKALKSVEKERDALQSRCDKLEAALRRLASPEAFIVSRMTNREERARMEYAEQALNNRSNEDE